MYFSEVSPRPHDTGMVTIGTQRCSEFELHARAVLGLPIDTTLISPGASAVILGEDLPEDVAVEYHGLAGRSPSRRPRSVSSASRPATTDAAWAWPSPPRETIEDARDRPPTPPGQSRSRQRRSHTTPTRLLRTPTLG